MIVNRPTQSEIAKALGMSQASIVKYRKRGMPTTSIDAAAAWHRANVKATAHRIPRDPVPPTFTDAAATRATALLDLAANAHTSGHDITALLPGLREALRAVPAGDRTEMLLPIAVMDVLTEHVRSAMPMETHDDVEQCEMSDEDADWMGRFWYSVAAGEVTLKQPDASRAGA